MNFFRNYPFVRLLSFQITGICVAGFFPAAEELLSVLLLVLALWLIKPAGQRKYPFDLVHSVILSVLIILIAVVNARHHQGPGLQTVSGLRYFEARILGNPAEKPNSLQLIIKVLQPDSLPITKQKLMVYLEKDEKARSLRAGDLITVQSVISKISNYGNPFEFNYRHYMSRKHIWHSTYIPSKNYMINYDDEPPLLMTIKRTQGKLASELKKSFNSDQAFQVVSALALGYRDELSRETQSYFILTGSMHILAVSGLHVGMLFMFLNVVLSFLKRSVTGRFLYFFIMASCLWGYALLTGFSPSVQRAAVMFSFILIGNSLKRPASVYNSIAASAFFLLFFNPDVFFEVGFQLSYMAVISIVFFYPKLNKLLKTDNPLLKRTGQLCCVSVAAQVGTFPLSIYYFHQFPVYSWLSNLIVVPAAYLILGFTGIYFLLSPFGQMTRFTARLLCGTADLTLWLLKKIGKFPFSVIDGLSISFVQFACLLMCLGLFMFFIVHKRHEFFFSGLSFLLLFQISGLAQKINLFSQRKLIIYQSAEQVIHLINGRTNYLITNSKKPPDPYLYKNVLLNLRLDPPFVIQRALPGEENFYDLLIHLPVIQFTDKSLILQDGTRYQDLPENTNSFRHGLLDLNRTGRNTIRLAPGQARQRQDTTNVKER